MENLKYKPVCNQVEVTPFLTNEKLIHFCKQRDIVTVAYAPLGTPGDRRVTPDTPMPLKNPVVLKISERYKKSPAQILLRWGLQRGYGVIPKSVNPDRIRENIQIFDFSLTEDEVSSISKLNQNHRIITFPEAKSDPYYPFNEEF